MFRKVRIRKVEGKQGETFPTGTERVGWEKETPTVGSRYCLYQDSGKVYRTGVVQTILPQGFVTGFSTYILEVVEVDRTGKIRTGEL
jgi:hypothetical protein